MSAITKAIFDRLKDDGTLTALLGSFSSAPSIFTLRPTPPGFSVSTHGPYILTTGESVAIPGLRETKTKAGLEIVRDILCFTDLALSPTRVEDIAYRVRTLFQGVASISIIGYSIVIAEATGPIEIDEEDARGRVVSVRWVLEEN